MMVNIFAMNLNLFSVTVDLTEPESGEVVDGVQTGFTDLKFSPSTAKVGAQWKGFHDPESGIQQYEVSVEVARSVHSTI